MNTKISAPVVCVEAIIYLLLNNLHECTFKTQTCNCGKINETIQ